MIGTEVEMSGEEHGNGDIVESSGWHGIRRFQYGIEVVRVPIVSYEGVDGKPEISLGGISIEERSCSIGGVEECRWDEEGLE